MAEERRVRSKLLWGGLAAVTILLILLTPIMLKFALPFEKDWQSLGNASQAYSGLSVIFSGAALLGVAASLLYQAKQTGITNEEAQREAYRQLLLTTLEHPEFMTCWAPPISPRSASTARKLIFTHLIITQWHTEYLLGRANDAAMRSLLERHFQGELAREHWVDRSTLWREFAEAGGNARAIKFADLMDEAYERAMISGPPVLSSAYFMTTDP
ncbi:DUF6082 family protein [Streptomyces sp. NPDC001165]|uniref:DUF6082 family protein n=1 Tax=Streptomyces sp. NPDC001165 TaxID=3364546 RepID=UPI0036C7B670